MAQDPPEDGDFEGMDIDREQLERQMGEGDAAQIQQARQQIWQAFEQQIFAWFNNLQAEIQTRKSTRWEPEDEAISTAASIEEANNEREAMREAMGDVQERLINVLNRYLQQHNNPQMDTQPLKNEMKNFLRELHNPESREVLLLAVKPEYRDHIRDRLTEFARLFWGTFDVAQGNLTGDYWYVITMVARSQGTSLEEVVAHMPDVTMADVPDEFTS